MLRKIFDISVDIQNELPVWPGDDKVQVSKSALIAEGSICNVTSLKLSGHTGTHVDAPLHFIDDGKGVESLNLETLIGTCQVLEFSTENILTRSDFEQQSINPMIPRILLKTKNSKLWENPSHEFKKEFVALSKDAAEFLVEKGVTLIGIDYLSISPYCDAPEIVHQILLEKEIIILEGIDLSKVNTGVYELICLPIKVKGADGVPCRAVLRTT